MSELYQEIYKLKNLERKGWHIRNISDNVTKRTESDAEHCFSMCLLALEIIKKENLNLNIEKVLKMCLYHELGEIDVGDITPLDNVTKLEKHNAELNGVSRISELSDMPEIKDIWLEFEENKTIEAKFVKMIDKLDTVIQSKIYSDINNRPEVFEEFYCRAMPIIKDFKKYI